MIDDAMRKGNKAPSSVPGSKCPAKMSAEPFY
jgi:hypothetical protein